MASLLNTALADALEFGATEAEQYKAQILAAAAAANVTIEQGVDMFIGSIKAGGALGLVLPSLKAAVINALHNAIAADAVQEEALLFDLIVAAAQNEAKALLAH